MLKTRQKENENEVVELRNVAIVTRLNVILIKKRKTFCNKDFFSSQNGPRNIYLI